MTDDILQILERLARGEINVEQIMETCGGRNWYFPTLRRYHQVQRYRAILQFPSRDYRVVVHHLGCSVSMVYRAWHSGLAS